MVRETSGNMPKQNNKIKTVNRAVIADGLQMG
jgi:hypothetical protein